MLQVSVLVAVIWMTLSCSTQALIVPQELPSVLSLVYSNIPPIRKGTDSRLGFGFRLGEHADFQVVVELGPQKDTRPLGPTNDESSSSKRQVNQNDYKKLPTTTDSTLPTTTESWLQTWSNNMRAKKKKPSTYNNKSQHKNSKNEISHQKPILKTRPMISESSLKQLLQLYKMATTESVPIEVEVTTKVPSVGSIEADKQQTAVKEKQQTTVKERKTKGEITEELMDVEMN